jgi:hypothetical protein
MVGLLVADALFVAGTAVLIVLLGGILEHRLRVGPAVGLVGGLLYLVNFAVPNLRLVGMVDAGEGFFLLSLLWCLAESKLWALPVIGVLGALAKESFVPFSVVMTATWWLSTQGALGRDLPPGDAARVRRRRIGSAAWILASWVLSGATTIAVQSSVSGTFASLLDFGLQLRGDDEFLGHFVRSLRDRNLWYVFLWLLPTAIPNLMRLPREWLAPVGGACAMAFALDAYYGAPPGAVGRALFSVAGPVLCLSSALLLVRSPS